MIAEIRRTLSSHSHSQMSPGKHHSEYQNGPIERACSNRDQLATINQWFRTIISIIRMTVHSPRVPSVLPSLDCELLNYSSNRNHTHRSGRQSFIVPASLPSHPTVPSSTDPIASASSATLWSALDPAQTWIRKSSRQRTCTRSESDRPTCSR